MWAIKILNGPNQGKIFPLQKGNNVVGRSAKADIRLADNGASKSHAQIFVTNDKVIISDLKSSNGTFVNGVKVQNHGLKTGDKILINQTIVTIFQLPDNVVFTDKKSGSPKLPSARGGARGPAAANALAVQGATALAPMMPNDLAPMPAMNAGASLAPVPSSQAVGLARVVEKADNYIDTVALPPIYKASEKMDFKYLLLIFTLSFIFLSTFLAALPLSRLTKESVLNESERRALTMARNLAQMNRKALQEDSELALNTDFVARESGVEKAMIITAKTGAILAPANLAGRYDKDPFIVSVRTGNSEKVAMINDTQVAASVPIKFFSSEVGDTLVNAYAVVVYNIDPLAIDFNRTLSLFVQIFMIACLIGIVIYFIQYRLIIHPMTRLNKEIDRALSEGLSNVTVPFKLPIFQDLISNVNSALSRISNEFGSTDQTASSGDKTVEAGELVKMFPVPSFAIDPATSRFIAVNPALDGHPLFDGAKLIDMSIDDLTDKSLFESLKDLISIATSTPNNRHSNILPSHGTESYEIMVKAVISGTKTAYLLFTVMQVAEDEGGS